ncbi:MAG TPA: hypothetical protein ENK83_02450, partial [Aliiroseovarius sp.]|nr:hypothetical protein [Aliiroseovarius sp.]
MDLLILGAGAAAQAGQADARARAVRVLGQDADGACLERVADGWLINGVCARRVLLAGRDALAIWQRAGGAVVLNPALG